MQATCIICFLSVYCSVHLDKESDSNKRQKEERNSVALTFLLHVAHEGRERVREGEESAMTNGLFLPACMHHHALSSTPPSVISRILI